jgi:hypothetical protein
MKRNLIFSFVALISICASAWAQKPKAPAKKPSTSQSAMTSAEKMGYARTNKYWGPGTYYCFAPGAPQNKMANNQETSFRDLLGISKEDCATEIAKQGYIEVPSKEVQRWFNENKSKDKKFYYSPDKSYILQPQIVDMEKSAEKDFIPYASKSMMRYVLVPKQDSLKMLELVWQYMRDMYEMKTVLVSFVSTFKKANPKAFPIEQAGSSGWNSLRAGSFVLRMVDGKPKGAWDRDENIVRRTMGNSEFELRVLGMETDFAYSLFVKLQKEGYVLTYSTLAITMNTLEPGANWVAEHKLRVASFTGSQKMEKDAVELYKKAPLPPVLEDLNKLLHTR